MNWLAAFWTEMQRGARALRKAPGFAAAAIATLALGIGADSATFSVVNAVLLRPLPYSHPESRVMIWSRWNAFEKTWLSEAEVLDYRRLVPSLKQVAAWSSGQANLTGDGEPVRVGVASITANTFSTLGASLFLGRAFEPSEELQGAGNVAIISHALWQSRFGGDPGALGATLVMDGVPRQIVGIAAPEFRLPTDFGEDAAEPTSVWVPLSMNTTTPARGNHGLYGAGELRPGATAKAASGELDALLRNLTREGLYPAAMGMSAFAVPLEDEILGGVRPALMLSIGAVSLLLLIACANVANLLLARAEVRQREIAVRAALGAGRSHLLRQLAAESLVLALPASLLGLGVAQIGIKAIVAADVAGIPRAASATLDARVLAFTAVTTLVTTFVFGLAPALRALSLNLTETLRDGGGSASIGSSRKRLRSLLVVGELALSVVLLTGASLLLRSLWALQRVELGFEPRGVLTARVALPRSSYETPEQVVALYRQVVERARSLPGVTSAGVIRMLPLGAQIGDWGLTIEGHPMPPGQGAKGDWQVASDGALEALGERLLRGRPIAVTDTTDSDQVALINETMARTYWPGEDPIGQRFRMGSEGRPWLSVVGIVRDVRHNGISAPVKEKFYRPHAQFHRSSGNPARNMTLVIRTATDPLALAAPLRAAIRELDPTLPLAAIRPMTDVVAAALATPRLAGGLLACFAGLALVLSCVGIYGVLSYLISQRAQEIGIRMAIGADSGRVLRLVLRDGLMLSLAGIGLGTLAAAALVRLAASLLHEVRPHDPATFALVPALLLAVAFVASYLPARRASRVDPLVALRSS